MIFIYGDSHANKCFKHLNLPFRDCHEQSITMHRIGRDNRIINFNSQEHDKNSILCLLYGEVDCRCHVQRQIDLGRLEDDIIQELVDKYWNTIVNNVVEYKKVIIVAVIPPTQQAEYEHLHGPIRHEFPFVGSDVDRVRFTTKMNALLEKYCNENPDYLFFDPYSYYRREDGTLKFEFSDTYGHVLENSVFLEKFVELYNSFSL